MRLYERLRRLVRLFGDAELDTHDLDQSEGDAEKLEGALNRAAAWRKIARVFKERKDDKCCRKALRTATRYADMVPLPFQRALNYALIADLQLELGEMDQAKQLVRKAQNSGEGALLEDLTGFTTGPLIMGVLVRTSDVNVAFNLAKSSEDVNNMVWSTLAGFCALKQKIGEVKNRLATIKPDWIKANLCLGVAEGLYERRLTTHKP